MYDFLPRIPVDHVLSLVQILRGQVNRERGDVLMLCGAVLGEVGAFYRQGLLVGVANVVPCETEESFDTAVLSFQEMSSEPNFDISPYIPFILKLIEILMKRFS